MNTHRTNSDSQQITYQSTYHHRCHGNWLCKQKRRCLYLNKYARMISVAAFNLQSHITFTSKWSSCWVCISNIRYIWLYRRDPHVDHIAWADDKFPSSTWDIKTAFYVEQKQMQFAWDHSKDKSERYVNKWPIALFLFLFTNHIVGRELRVERRSKWEMPFFFPYRHRVNGAQ